MEFYRYEEHNNSVRLITLNLHKETLMGYWIGYGSTNVGSLRSESRWVAKSGKKRYAYPTKKEALTSLFKRKKQQVRILKKQLRTAEIALRNAEGMIKNLELKK
jgi:hypothetical protein